MFKVANFDSLINKAMTHYALAEMEIFLQSTYEERSVMF